jgi:ABC-type spermidine/putrescine transport system permease subunit II
MVPTPRRARAARQLTARQLSGRARTGLLAALLLASPVLIGVIYAGLASVGLAGVGARGLTGLPWLRVFADPGTWAGVGWTLWVAAASTTLATAGAMALAVAFRGSGRLDGAARLLALLPLPIPHLVAGVGAVLILGQSGILARLAYQAGLVAVPAEMPALVSDPWGVGLILALTWKEIPFLSLVAFSILATRGTLLEEAARTLGAGPLATIRHVTLPVLWRGMLPAVVAVFTFVAGSWEVAVLLAPSDPLALPLQVMERHTDPALSRRGEAYVLVLVALALAGLAVAVHERLRSRWEVLER